MSLRDNSRLFSDFQETVPFFSDFTGNVHNPGHISGFQGFPSWVDFSGLTQKFKFHIS